MTSGAAKILVAETLTGIHTPFRDPRAQIRLIRFDHKNSDGSISASLETWDIESAPPYNAISYAWGEPSTRHAITINDFRLPVRQNCFHALRQTRLHYPNDHVWIDAICINQLDLEEKSAQVAMMGGIYSTASLVLACIGPSDDFIRTAHELYGTAIFQDTERWGEPEKVGIWKVNMSPLSYKWYPKSLADSSLFFPRHGEDQILTARLCTEWNALTEKPYFQRAWIVQELSGGKDRTIILCGQDAIGWTRVIRLGWRLSQITANPITGNRVPCFYIHLIMLNELIYSNDRSLTAYLGRMHSLDCQDIRDRIFSVVSVVDWKASGEVPLLPDYNMTHHQLASEFMWRLSEQDAHHVLNIVWALELYNDAALMLGHLDNEGLAHCPGMSSDDIPGRWTTLVSGAHFIDRDATGRFQIVPRLTTTSAYENECDAWLPHESDELSKIDAVRLYAGETLVGFVSGSLRRGDILISSHGLDLIVRARSDASTFSVVGGACISFALREWMGAMKGAEVCECWSVALPIHTYLDVKVDFEASRREILADRIAQEAVRYDSRYIKTYLEQYAIGTLHAGSLVRDVTLLNWSGHQISGPPNLLCAAHRSSELHRIQGNPLWCTILSSGEGSIRVHDTGSTSTDDRQQGSSSSGWLTEEECSSSSEYSTEEL